MINKSTIQNLANGFQAAIDDAATVEEANQLSLIANLLQRYAMTKSKWLEAIAAQDTETTEECAERTIKLDDRLIRAVDEVK